MRSHRYLAASALVVAFGVGCTLVVDLSGLSDLSGESDGGTSDAVTGDRSAGGDADRGDAGAVECRPLDVDCGAQLQVDPNHCGACGRRCPSGACARGQCRPEILADEGVYNSKTFTKPSVFPDHDPIDVNVGGHRSSAASWCFDLVGDDERYAMWRSSSKRQRRFDRPGRGRERALGSGR